ncbi:hypothetical protein [Dietzia maris]|uniref:hypothetical protein n=1 Tax=Dietzia maris TaxID=37915 RepID=UPI003002179B
MADSDAQSPPVATTAGAPRVHDRAAQVIVAAGGRVPDARGGAVLAVAGGDDQGGPPTVERVAGGCGGGRRVLLEGRAVVRSDGVRPTHLLVWASGPDGGEVLVLVERGDRRVSPWPAEGTTAGEIGFEAVRLDADRVVSGTLA